MDINEENCTWTNLKSQALQSNGCRLFSGVFLASAASLITQHVSNLYSEVKNFKMVWTRMA